jgi:hypothetical protein
MSSLNLRILDVKSRSTQCCSTSPRHNECRPTTTS